MKSKYPIILVHGIMLKDFKFFKAFGKIEKVLKEEGYYVVTSKTDGFGSIENNALQLKQQIKELLLELKVDKVNIIAHSKGGLDSKYLINELGMANKVASLTTLCTPHKGSKIADFILRLPKWIIKILSFWINLVYKIFKDKNPDCVKVANQLRCIDIEEEINVIADEVYCQSYSTTLKRSRDDFIMGIPLIFSKKLEKDDSDGMVSRKSAEFGEYHGDCIEDSVSHSEIVGFSFSKKKRCKIYDFYKELALDLVNRGY